MSGISPIPRVSGARTPAREEVLEHPNDATFQLRNALEKREATDLPCPPCCMSDNAYTRCFLQMKGLSLFV